METLRRIGLDRLGLLVGPTSPVTPAVATAILAELAHVGIRIDNPEKITDGIAGDLVEVIQHVRKKRGERGTFAPLFNSFPEKLPTWDNAEMRFMLAACRLIGDGDDSTFTDEQITEALDFSSIGWWPASSIPQNIEKTHLDRRIQELLPRDTRTEWTTVRIVSNDELIAELGNYMRDCFTSAVSLRDDVKSDLVKLTRKLPIDDIDVSKVRFRETRTLLFRIIWDTNKEALPGTFPTPDDLLRLFADLTESDTSLTEKIRFPKLSRQDRRIVIACLENSLRLGEIFRRRGLWLAVAKSLHVGEHKAPNVSDAFARLRDSRHDKISFGSRFEAAVSESYELAIKMAFVEAPTVLLRHLRRLASLAQNVEQEHALCDLTADLAQKVPLNILLTARSQITDNGATYPRLALTKRGGKLVISNVPGHLAISRSFQSQLLSALNYSIAMTIGTKETWKDERVYIDPGISGLLLPDALRSTAQGLIQVERGSRLTTGEANVVRLFVHWKESGSTTDLDLSCMALDDKYNLVGQVSWTNLGNGTMTHSGDLTSSAAGAQEFIDINLAGIRDRAKTSGWRYLVPVIFRYAGEKFSELEEGYAGWMLRDRVSSDRKTFDPATVVNAFPLTGSQRTAVPILLDIMTSEVLYVDVYLPGMPTARVENEADNISTLVRLAANRAKLKPSITDLAKLHTLIRGAVEVKSLEESTISFGIGDEFTYNVVRPEKLLSELL